MSLASLAMVGATVGVATGSIANDKATIQAQADTTSAGTILYLKPNSNWTSAGARFAAYFFNDEGEVWKDMAAVPTKTGLYWVEAPSGYETFVFCRMNGSTTTNNWDNKWNQTGNLTYKQLNNTYAVPDGYWDDQNNEGTWSKEGITVNFKGIMSDDSSNVRNLSSTKADYVAAYNAPTSYRVADYHFEGTWYTDEACTSEYSSVILTEETTLYGKFTKLVNDAYFYVIPSSTSEVAWNVYTYGSGTYDQQFGAWPGSAISSSMLGVTAGDPVMLGGVETLVYQVPYAVSANDTNVIINDGGSNQTADLTLESKTAVFWNGYGVKDGEGNNTAGVTDLNKGKVTDLVINLKKAIDGATDHSVCNISKDEATKLVAARDALPEGMASYWAGSKIKTYTGSSLETKGYVPVTDIMVQVEAIASASTNPLNNIGTNVSANPTAFIVAGVSVVGLVAVGGIFLLRKKKEN